MDAEIYLPEAAAAIGLPETVARYWAREHGVLRDRAGDDPEDVPVRGGGIGRHFRLDRSSMRRFHRLLFLNEPAPEVSDVASRRTVGLAIYPLGGMWLGIGEVDVLREVAAAQPNLCSVYETGADNRVEVVVRGDESVLREAVSEAWRP